MVAKINGAEFKITRETKMHRENCYLNIRQLNLKKKQLQMLLVAIAIHNDNNQS